MSLNKRQCRKFADPGLKMRSGSGILCVEQVSYIVRTSIKNINCHRTLVLYVYSRKQAAKGDFKPVWTVFQRNDDFITLERREDGSTAWRKSSFNRLDSNWDLSGKSAFYSARDEMRVNRYFNSSDSGFQALSAAQTAIQARRWKERQLNKEREIISRMSCIKVLPRGLKGWIHKAVMPSYFFYDYKRGGRDVPGICSSCGKEAVFSGVKQGVRKICPHCHKELVCKPRSRKGKCMFDRDTVQVIQSTGDGALVLRIVKIYYSYYETDVAKISIYENARHFVYLNPDNKKVCCESYYYSYNSGFLTGWKKGDRPTFSPFQYNFEVDAMGWLYTGNLPGGLSGAWKYCPIADFYGWLQKPLLVLPFLYAYLEHPALEHLVKAKFIALVSNLVYDYGRSCLDETQHRTHRILQVAAEDVDFLRSINPDMHTLRTFQEYAGLKGRQELLAWQLEHKVSRDILPALHMTPHKYMRYLDRQYAFLKLRKTAIGGIRYKNMQDLATEYRDYLEICENLKYDLKNSFVLYPKDMQKSHDRAAKNQKQKADARIRRDFNAAYRKIKGRLDFEYSGMKIILPSTPNEVVKEGHALHHCVGSYVDRVARQECIIVFLRQCGDPSRPFYTVEIRGHEISQVRGLKNCSPEPEVKAFIKAWETQVLSRLDNAA